MIRMQVRNPYMDETYELDTTLEGWMIFLENKQRGNEEFFIAKTKSGQVITINPSNYASVTVVEVEPF